MNVYGGLSPLFVEQKLKSLAAKYAQKVATLQPTAVRRSKVVLGVQEDVSDPDELVQDEFVAEFIQAVPGVGVIGEERELFIPCTIPGHDVYLTVDSIDGTRNYLDGAQDGVAFMVALVANGRVSATYIVDVFTGKTVGFGPHSKTVQQWEGFDFGGESQNLSDINRERPLSKQTVLLRGSLAKYPPALSALLGDFSVFRSNMRMQGSIGLTFAYLASGQAGAIALRCSEVSKTTPWDDTPLIGLCERLGFVFLKLKPDHTGLVQYIPRLPREVYRREHPSLVVHASQVYDLHRAFAKLKG